MKDIPCIGLIELIVLINISKREWEPLEETKRCHGACSSAVIDDKIFIGGGLSADKSIECFLMERQKWIFIKSNPMFDCQWSSWNGKLIATGGQEESDCVDLYDELSAEWLPLPSMNIAREEHGVCETKDNELIVVGGVGALYSVECLKL